MACEARRFAHANPRGKKMKIHVAELISATCCAADEIRVMVTRKYKYKVLKIKTSSCTRPQCISARRRSNTIHSQEEAIARKDLRPVLPITR